MNGTELAMEDELENSDLLCDIQKDSELTCLSEMVRKHYFSYLEKQLKENLKNSGSNIIYYDVNKENYENIYGESIKKTAELLEDKAIKACMIAQFYQRAMVKIISIVRRSTQEKRIITHLEKLILTQRESQLKTSNKETQTETELSKNIEQYEIPKYSQSPKKLDENDDEYPMTLDEKIKMFQKHLQNEKCAEVIKKVSLIKSADHKMSERKRKHNQRKFHHRPYKENHHKIHRNEIDFSPTKSIITPQTSPNHPTSPLITQTKPLNTIVVESKVEDNDDNDSVGLELARLFSEEKTELDEIFGIDPNEEPDDPQICKILKEIEESKVNHEKPSKFNNTITQQIVEEHRLELSVNHHTIESNIKEHNRVTISPAKTYDLSKSIWPCELFMQKRKLSESLARLIEEDLRWHDVMKWKFFELFGEDSDDEFTPCSPSIELDEILMGSCIKRISPWVVKHLMKPMKDGLIGNRFLFKKLAKNMARCIITENQYPDEALIKNCIENFFCLHQAVMSSEDLVDIPSISLL